jgi:hypothetical protein
MYVGFALIAAAAFTAALALGGSATGATLYTCAGVPADAPRTQYPEKRYYVETQAWWSPMPGHTAAEPFQDRTGHLHVAACVPLYQTVSGGKLQLDLKWQEHMMQGVNGVGAPVPTNFIVEVQGLYKGSNLRNLGLWKGVPCATMQCDGWISTDFDYSSAPSGWGNLNTFIQTFFTDCAAGPPNCRQMRTLNHWPINFVTNVPSVAPGTEGLTAPPNDYTGGESWFTRDEGGSAYARTFVQRAELAKLWNPDTGQLVPKSGTFNITITGEKDGNRAMIDPAMHAMPPVLGKVLVDEPPVTGAYAYKGFTLAIDTTKLTDGIHKLAFQNIYKRAAGEQSGVIVLPFLVANNPAPATSTTAPATTTTAPATTTTPTGTTTTTPTGTTTPPPAGSGVTPPMHHPGMHMSATANQKPTCAQYRARHKKHVAALRAAVTRLKHKLRRAGTRADRAAFTRRILETRKSVARLTRCP